MRNKATSNSLINDLKKLPGTIHAAGLQAAIYELPINTFQDSGNAAFNWVADSGKTTARVYLSLRGEGKDPVGNRGDNRTYNDMNLDAVSVFRAMQAHKLLQAIREGKVKVSTIANPIDDGSYDVNAELDKAIKASKDFIEDAMSKAAKSGSFE